MSRETNIILRQYTLSMSQGQKSRNRADQKNFDCSRFNYHIIRNIKDNSEKVNNTQLHDT